MTSIADLAEDARDWIYGIRAQYWRWRERPTVLPEAVWTDILDALAGHLEAGINPDEAVSAMATAFLKEDPKSKPGMVLVGWSQSLKGGERLGATMAARLPQEIQAAIIAGDKGGALPKAMRDIVAMQRRVQASQKKIGQGVAQPVIYMAMSWATYIYFNHVLIPDLVALAGKIEFRGIGGVFVMLTDFASNPITMAMGAGLAAAVAVGIPGLLRLRWAGHLKWVRSMLERVPPGIFTVLRMRLSTMQSFQALLQVGLTPAEAFETIAETSAPAIRDDLLAMAKKLRNGEKLWDVMGDFPMPGLSVWLEVYAGRSGGLSLEQSVGEIVRLYLDRMERRIGRITAALTVLSIAAFGCLMLFSYAAVFDLNAQVGAAMRRGM